MGLFVSKADKQQALEEARERSNSDTIASATVYDMTGRVKARFINGEQVHPAPKGRKDQR